VTAPMRRLICSAVAERDRPKVGPVRTIRKCVPPLAILASACIFDP
jgi:hypothetical protein